MKDPAELAQELIGRIRSLESAVVALSGGVDSAVVAAASFRALGTKAIAVTGIGAAVSSSEANDARQIAELIGIEHVELVTTEINDPDYVKNDARRCYYCKSTLYSSLSSYASKHGFRAVVSGTNLDDLGDYRPGIEAGKEFEVSTPLADLGITKNQVRQIASYFKLPVMDKPASPCLASRIAYGQSVTPKRLSQIEQAEAYLHNQGFFDVRVRLHADDLARIELHPQDLVRMLAPEVQLEVSAEFLKLGFKFVTLDLNGRQSGSLNKVLPILQ